MNECVTDAPTSIVRDAASATNLDEISIGSALIGPLVLCSIMFAGGASLSYAANIDVRGLFTSYIETAAAVTLVCLAIFVFLAFARLALQLADRPIPTVAKALQQRLPTLVLPVVVFPVFLASYTAAKVATPYMVGYHWDAFWADLDRLIFRDDAWRIAHRLLGSSSVSAWEWVYTVGWGFAFAFSMALTAIYLPRRRVAIFYTAMMGTWLIGGWLLAYCFPAAGPVFAHLFDPTLADRFAPLRAELKAALPPGGAVQITQEYLASAVYSHRAVNGGGVSAMPSMHLGAASIYVLLARGTPWVFPALLFWLIVFVGSAYFGYHYWLDGIVAAGVAWACWALAEKYYGERAAREVRINAALKPLLAWRGQT
jgi:hypothetical protein